MFKVGFGTKQEDEEKVKNILRRLYDDHGYTELEARIGVALIIAVSDPFISKLFSITEDELVGHITEAMELTKNAPISEFCPYPPTRFKVS